MALVTYFSQNVSTNIPVGKGKKRDALILERADNVEYMQIKNIGEDIVKIRGRATIAYKNDKLRADTITINLKTKKIYGWGDVYLVEGSRTILGESFFYDMEKEKGAVYQASTVIDGLLYSGAGIKNLDKDFYKVENGYFSTCAYDHPHYYLGVNKIWLYPDNSFLIMHLRYIVGGTTLFYFPFAFKTKKGTGITSYAGYSSSKGFFLQNTYGVKSLRKILNLELRADYYQFNGIYAGTSMKLMKMDISLNAAMNRTLQIDGSYLNTFRWMNTVNLNHSFSIPAKTLTQIQAYYFNTSDTFFHSDYMTRSYKGGISFDSLNLLQTTSPYHNPSYYNQNTYYLTLSDSRGPSYLSLALRMNVLWNNVSDKFVFSTMQLPDATYRYSGSFSPFIKKSNETALYRLGTFFLNDFRWSAYSTVNNRVYLDMLTQKYMKNEISWNTYANLSKSFLIGKIFSYSPSLRTGNIYLTGKGLNESELLNFKNASYLYLAYSEGYQFNIHGLFRIKVPFSSYFNFSRNMNWRMDHSIKSEYGRKNSFSGTLSYYFGLKGFSYSANVSANFLTKTNIPLRLDDRSIYNNINQSASLNIYNRLIIRDSHQYSIKDSKHVGNIFNMSWGHSKFNLFNMKIESANMNTVFNYNFDNPLQSYILVNWEFSFEPFKYTSINISGSSRNRQLYVYSKNLLEKYGYSPLLYRNIGTDLLDSFNFLDINKRKNSMFKMQSVSLYFKHDLHCWEMDGGYTLYQQYTSIPYYDNIGYPYWEHRIWIQINLKNYESVRYKKEKVSPPPVFENQ